LRNMSYSAILSREKAAFFLAFLQHILSKKKNLYEGLRKRAFFFAKEICKVDA